MACNPKEIDEFLRDLMPRLGARAREGFENPGAITFKDPGQPVTATDRDVEAMAREAILGAWPDHGILGEEEGDSIGAARTVWYIDPIDGTSNFSRGIPFFSISIGVRDSGRGVAGHVLDPLRRELFRSFAGGGAWLGDRQLTLGTARTLAETSMSVLFTAGGRYLQEPGLLLQIDRAVRKTRKLGSMALEMAYVAAGRYDLLAAGKAVPQAWWDIAAGWTLVEEAGGCVLDLDRAALTPETSHFLAGPSPLVEAFLDRFHPRGSDPA